ncbi:MAG: hypothetical protein KAV42_09905 [Candidatus Krumholzibacteria bacterium]|nr:hypothetical protein [Candidatus Krumholzibacteria bacterium]
MSCKNRYFTGIALILVAVAMVFCMGGPLAASTEESLSTAGTEEFSFDPDEFSKSPWSFDGFIQLDPSFLRFDQDASLYRLNFSGNDGDLYRFQGGIEIQAGLTYQRGFFKAYSLGKVEERYDGEQWDGDGLLYEGNISLQAGPNAYFTIGKNLLRWGKGYAWNPVNFVGRDRNPSDPDLSLEGYWMVFADAVKSLKGPLRTISLSTAIVPVTADINSSFGKEDYINVAGKLYFLFYDTDIDFVAMSKGSRTPRFGFAMSRNITGSFEIHGESTLITDSSRKVIDSEGDLISEREDVWSYLAGIRYLTSAETTFIIEYYRNGEGYTGEQADDYFEFIGSASDEVLSGTLPSIPGYNRPNFMRNYLYLKASQKEPFGWLYVTPGLFTIYNIDDGSFNIIPEVSLTRVENLELRFRFNYLSGERGTEYGEKPNDWKAEIRARYFF